MRSKGKKVQKLWPGQTDRETGKECTSRIFNGGKYEPLNSGIGSNKLTFALWKPSREYSNPGVIRLDLLHTNN